MSPLVLVVDDNADQHAICAAYLAHAGYQVAHAYDAADALRQAQEARASLVLTDLVMPRMSGLDLLRAIRGDPALQRVPVVAVTADLVGWNEARAADAGFDGFLPKPYNLSRLGALAERLLGHDTMKT